MLRLENLAVISEVAIFVIAQLVLHVTGNQWSSMEGAAALDRGPNCSVLL